METPCKSTLLPLLFHAAIILLIPLDVMAEVRATLTAMSNYISRGYSKSDGKFSYLANIDYQHQSGLYLGSSAIYVDFGDSEFDDAARVEITPYLGWSFSLSDHWRLDGQWTRYLYDGTIFGLESDYNEFYLFLHYKDLLSAAVSVSEDYYQRGHAAANYELTGRYPVTDFLEFSSGAGYSLTKQVLDFDYLYWNAGLTFFYRFISLDFRYVDALHTSSSPIHAPTDPLDYYPDIINPSFVFSVSIGF